VMRLANRSETDMFALPSLMIDVMERVVQARALLRSSIALTVVLASRPAYHRPRCCTALTNTRLT
jgi:hypothetical protein